MLTLRGGGCGGVAHFTFDVGGGGAILRGGGGEGGGVAICASDAGGVAFSAEVFNNLIFMFSLVSAQRHG